MTYKIKIEAHCTKITAREKGPQGRVGKAWVPKWIPWEVLRWQFGEHPPCCRRNAEGYHVNMNCDLFEDSHLSIFGYLFLILNEKEKKK